MKKVTKFELTQRLAFKMDTTHKNAIQIFNYFLDTVSDCLTENKEISIRNFGSFQIRRNKARQVRNPKTGKTYLMPSRKRIHFKAGKFLKQEVCNEK